MPGDRIRVSVHDGELAFAKIGEPKGARGK
jgi:hypothetical protein